MNMTDRPLSATDTGRELPRRRAWHAAFAVLALIPAVTSVLTLVVGVERFVAVDDVDVALDSTYRYLGGVYLGLVLLAVWAIRRIEERADALIVVTGAIFLGGIGRLVSIVDHGVPSPGTWGALVIELGSLGLALTLRRNLRAQ
ncbi:MAG: DUF4345 domain-containing protein [Actinomycetota bacterium]